MVSDQTERNSKPEAFGPLLCGGETQHNFQTGFVAGHLIRFGYEQGS